MVIYFIKNSKFRIIIYLLISKVPFMTLINNVMYRYNPRVGIITNDTRELDKNEHLICNFERNGTTTVRLAKVIVESRWQ